MADELRARTPNRKRHQLPPLKRLDTRVPADLWDAVDRLAAADGRSLSSYVMRLLQAVADGRVKVTPAPTDDTCRR